MITVFSQRHYQALNDKKLQISISTRTRQKIIFCMQNYNQLYGWNNEDSVFHDDLKRKFMEVHGITELRAYVMDELKRVEQIEDFIKGAWPPHVLDAVEVYNQLVEIDRKTEFERDINGIFRVEETPYRLLESEIVILDSVFLESSVLNKAYKLLKTNYFEKACKDFLNARTNFTSGDWSGTVFECNNAMESALKKITDLERGDQLKLKSALMKAGIVPDYFQGFCEYFEGLLQSSFTIANQSARHGKKDLPSDRNKVGRALASFVLHLTGSLLVFLIERYEEMRKEEEDLGTDLEPF